MRANRTVIFLGDGMADEPVEALGGRTPLEAARTPGMDAIAREGRCGTLLTLPKDFPTSSEVANMSVLGCDLKTEYGGRGPLEAAGRGIPLGPDDKAFRLNLTTVEDGVLKDFSGGHLSQADADELIRLLNSRFGCHRMRFHAGVSYRNLLVLSGAEFSHLVHAEKPDDHQGDRVADHLPRARSAEAEHTAALLRKLVQEATPVLEACPTNKDKAARKQPQANGVWPWSGGCAGSLRPLRDKYGISGAVISAVDVINGLGRCLGMDVIPVAGATGYVDTNYEGKADAAIEALKTHDLVYVHVEAIDEVSHERNLDLKLKAIEDFDKRLISRVLAAIGPDTAAAVLPDHPVPVAIGKHTRNPVPVAIRMPGWTPDAVTTYGERTCPTGSLGALQGGDFMALLFGPPRNAPRP